MRAFILGLAFFISACQPSARDINFPVLPEGLSDCKFYDVSNGTTSITVARCPNSATSTRWTTGTHKSRSTHYAIVVE